MNIYCNKNQKWWAGRGDDGGLTIPEHPSPQAPVYHTFSGVCVLYLDGLCIFHSCLCVCFCLRCATTCATTNACQVAKSHFFNAPRPSAGLVLDFSVHTRLISPPSLPSLSDRTDNDHRVSHEVPFSVIDYGVPSHLGGRSGVEDIRGFGALGLLHSHSFGTFAN